MTRSSGSITFWSPVPLCGPDDTIDFGSGPVAIRDLPSCMFGPVITSALPAELPAPTKRRARKPSLSGELRKAYKAGLNVRHARIRPDGEIALDFGEQEPTEETNPWLKELTKQ